MTSKAQDKLLLLLSTQGGPPAVCRRLTALPYVTDGSVGYMDDCSGCVGVGGEKGDSECFCFSPRDHVCFSSGATYFKESSDGKTNAPRMLTQRLAGQGSRVKEAAPARPVVSLPILALTTPGH